MPKKKKPQDLNQLKTVWYRKLKQSGFKDIERDEDTLKNWSSIFAYQKPGNNWQSKEEYYRYAAHFLEEHKFETELQKIIWEYHANGLSMRNIAKTLNKTRVTKTNYTSVWQVIKKLKVGMYKLYNIHSSKVNE